MEEPSGLGQGSTGSLDVPGQGAESDVGTPRAMRAAVFSSKTRLGAFAFAVAALGVLIYAGFTAGQRHLTTERHHPVLEVDPASLRIGKVDATIDFPWTLRVTNVSQRSVRVADIKASCGCTQIHPRSFTIKPGESKAVEFHINLAVTRRVGAKSLESPLEIKIVPIVEGANLPQPYWTLTATVIAPCLLDTDKIVLCGSDALVEGQPVNPKTIRGTLSSGDITVTSKTEHQADIVQVSRFEGGNDIEVVVQPAADRPQGWFSSPVELILTDATGKPRGTLEVEIQGEVLPAFRFYPRTLTLGALKVGTSVQLDIAVDCTYGKLLDASAMPDGMDVLIEPSGNESATVRASFMVTKLGPQQRAVHLIYESNDGIISTAEVPIWLLGNPAPTKKDGGK